MSGGLSFTENYIDLVTSYNPYKGFVNTICQSHKTVKYNSPMPPLSKQSLANTLDLTINEVKKKRRQLQHC